MTVNRDRLLALYLAGELSKEEAREVESWLESSEFDTEMESLSTISDKLRESDSDMPDFSGVDIYPALNRRMFEPTPFERVGARRLTLVGIAVAAILAFMVAFYVPRSHECERVFSPPNIAFALDVEFKSGDMKEFALLGDTPGSLPPGTLLRARSNSFFKFADGSSVKLEPDTILRIGGNERFNYSFSLLQGKIMADIRSEYFRIATHPTVFSSCVAIFELFQDSPYSHANDDVTAALNARPWQWLTSISVLSGVVTSEDGLFTENDRRIWAFDGPTGTQAAMLDKFMK